MEVKRENILSLQIDNISDVGICRRKAVNLASQIGFDEVKTGEVAIMVTEMVTNVIKHGGGKGKVVICQFRDAQDHKAIEVWCCDSGSGIHDFQDAIKDGISAKDSLGIGMGSIRRLSDEMQINPDLGKEFKDTFFAGNPIYKNCIRTLKYVPNKHWIGTNKMLEIGAASRCKPGEILNGDSYVVSHVKPHLCIAAVLDGLGHGKEANMASQLAREQIILKSELPLDALMQHIHRSLRGTRGSTIGLMRLDTKLRKLTFSGIGNIESFLLTSDEKRSLLSFGGIMGHNMRTPRIFEYEFNPGDSICMYSDGITTRWKIEDLDWSDHPQKNAETIINQYSRLNDDATVLIIRYTA
jgi:anti-sigma regulatory factor (Ser/Thr protein kinase)/serine/threonine protein phosphatase PrpC